MLGRISDVFVVKMDTTEICFSSQSSKKSLRARQSRKQVQVGHKKTLCRQCLCLAWKLSPNRRHCLQMCVIVLRHPLVKELSVGPTVLSVAALSYALSLEREREPSGTYIFSCQIGSAHQGDAAYATRNRRTHDSGQENQTSVAP